MLNATNLTAEWQELATENEVAHLRADLCLSDPDSYTLAEKRNICERIDEADDAIDAALRAAFEADPPGLQAAMLDLLEKFDPERFGWWLSVAGGRHPRRPARVVAADSIEQETALPAIQASRVASRCG